MTQRKILVLLLELVTLVFLVGAVFFIAPSLYEARSQRVEATWDLVKWNSGTMQVVVYGPNPKKLHRILTGAYDEIVRLDAIINEHDPLCEAGKVRLRLEKGEKEIALSPELYRLIEFACQGYEKSAGAFDITIAPLLKLWQEAAKTNHLPTLDEIESTKKRVGGYAISLLPETKTLCSRIPGLSIALGGFTKGYAADQVAQKLKKQGIQEGLVSVAGHIVGFGERKWKVGIQDPRIVDADEASSSIGSIVLCNKALATSGHYRRFSVIEGKRYSHIVDPRTGHTVPLTTVSATVIANTCMEADLYATVFCILDPQEALTLAAKLHFEVLLITQKDNRYFLEETPGFNEYWVHRPDAKIFQKKS